jgi:hypothetical protein
LNIRRKLLAAVPFVLLVVVGILAYHQVDVTITGDDRRSLGLILELGGVEPLPAGADYEHQVAFILAVQKAVLAASPGGKGLPQDAPREPADLYRGRTGSSHDRSRALEKALALYGLEVRHALMLPRGPDEGALGALLDSHQAPRAVCEVKTAKGWLLLDSDSPWAALDQDFNPRDLAALQADVAGKRIAWHPGQSLKVPDFFRKPFTYVYGLYSRNGRLYPPYNCVPDVFWPQMRYNLLPG